MHRLAALIFVALMLTACSTASSPEVPPGAGGEVDPVLDLGRDIFSSKCARCHGASGQGTSRAPQLNNARVVAQYPEIADQIDLVTNGRSGMPAFADNLDDDEIEAVVRYTREVLSEVGG